MSGYPAPTVRCMGNGERKSDYHGFRTPPISVSRDDWDRFKDLVGSRQRAEILRAFISWYVGRPGAKMPRRPKPPG